MIVYFQNQSFSKQKSSSDTLTPLECHFLFEWSLVCKRESYYRGQTLKVGLYFFDEKSLRYAFAIE